MGKLGSLLRDRPADTVALAVGSSDCRPSDLAGRKLEAARITPLACESRQRRPRYVQMRLDVSSLTAHQVLRCLRNFISIRQTRITMELETSSLRSRRSWSLRSMSLRDIPSNCCRIRNTVEECGQVSSCKSSDRLLVFSSSIISWFVKCDDDL
jgi:hypothetical protein